MKTNLENYEERFFDYMEGQLSPEEMTDVEAFVAAHPELEEDFRWSRACKLEPDTSITYTHKEALTQPAEKKALVIPLFVKIASVAAAIAVFVGIGWHLNPYAKVPGLTTCPPIANLQPIPAKCLETSQQETPLAKTRLKRVRLSTPPMDWSDYEEIASLEPVRLNRLPWNGNIVYGELEIQASSLPKPQLEESLATTTEENFVDNARKLWGSIYKQTAKTFLTAYYTADCYLDEARERAGR